MWLPLVANAVASAAPAATTIQYAEPVALALSGAETHFDAYGRRFDLTLADNDRVLSKLSAARKAELSSIRVLRGAVDGAPGSWVRLTQSGAGIEGAIWDGQDLYAVTTYARVADQLSMPLAVAVAGDQAVIYRLSDTRDALPRDFCASAASTRSANVTALDDYLAMVQELGQMAPTLTRQIEISLIGDAALQSVESDPTVAMLARLNIVEGIFSAQLGLLVLATDVRLMPVGADTLTSTKGATLLEQLGNYRSMHPEVRARGLAHLVTGKDLEGNTAGIAYVGTVCDAQNGVSISEHAYGTTISALIMAHEIGHNLGATHDGEPNTTCASVTGSFIMAPAVTGSATFSNCSLDLMSRLIASASCVTPAEYADVTVETSATSVKGEGGQAFTLPFLVRSAGNRAAEDVTATVTLPSMAGFVIESATSSTGSCSTEALQVTCALATLGAGESQSIAVTARGSSAANFTAQARVTASNDRITSNNSRSLPVSLRSGIDAAVLLSADSLDLPLGSPLEIYADVSSLRSMPLRNATLSFNMSQPITSASMPGANCSVNAFAVSCSITELPAGMVRRLTAQATTVSGGPLFAAAGITVSGEGDFTNNNANLSGWVRPDHDIDLTVSSGTESIGVGAPYEIAYTLRSRGSGPTDAVTLLLSIASSAIVVDSVDASGGLCAPFDMTAMRCVFAAMAPGESRVARVRVHATRPLSSEVVASAATDNDLYAANNSVVVHLRAEHAVDLAVTLASGGSGVEASTFEGQVTLRSNGRDAVRNATLDVVLHEAGTLCGVNVHNGVACTLLTPQRARCALPSLARNAQLFVDYQAQFAEAGQYGITFVTVAPGDTAPENDALARVVLVRPYYDIAVSGSLDLPDLVVGETRATTFAVTTARRGLSTARFVAPHYLPGLRVESIRATAGQCGVDAGEGGVCDFSDLPPNGQIAVTVTYRAEAAPYASDIAASVSTAGDVSALNDAVRGLVVTHAMTDLELRVGASVGGPKNSTLTFPEIALVNGAEKAVGTRLEVTLPPEVSLVGISASDAICSGTTVLRCDFSDLASRSTSIVQLSVRAAADGRFVATLKLSALNAPQNAREVAIEVAGGTSAPLAGGKSGGGRMEWLTLLALALLVVQQKWGHSSFCCNNRKAPLRRSGTSSIVTAK